MPHRIEVFGGRVALNLALAGAAILAVTHDPAAARRMDRCLLLRRRTGAVAAAEV